MRFLRTKWLGNFKNQKTLNKTIWLKIKLYKCYNFQKDGQAKDMDILTITYNFQTLHHFKQRRIQDFPGGTNSQSGIILHKFCQKLHENERIWTPGARPWRPLGSANDNGQRNLWLFVEMYSLLRHVSPCSSLSIIPSFRASNALLVGAKTVNCPFSLRTEFRPTRPITVTIWFTNPRIIVRFLSWQLERQSTHQLNLVTCNACCHCFWK